MAFDDFESPGFSPDDDSSASFGDNTDRPAVFVATRKPVTLTVTQLDDPRAPESSALAAYIGGRLVARSAMPPEAIARLVELHLFDEPVRLGLFAYVEAPGLQCRLFALVPRTSLEANAHNAEPWKASVPSYEAASRDIDDDDDVDDTDEEGDEDQEPEVPFETVLLGHIVRFDKDRQHGENLAAEAIDILQKVIFGADALQDADQKAIDDLLGSL